MRTEQVNLRLEEDLLVDLEHVAAEEALDRGTVIRRLLKDSLRRRRIDQAVHGYQRGALSMERAAEEAQLSLWEMMEILRRERVPHSMTAEDVRESLHELGDVSAASDPERPGFQAELTWLDSSVVTLADVPPREGHILLVGINPAPVSVAAGHYYQGQLGKRLWARLRRLDLLTGPVIPGKEDEAFSRSGHGLTDLVKRPTRAAGEIDDEEMRTGIDILREKVRAWQPGLILFAFKKTASILFPASHLQPGPGPKLEGARTFLLSGPYAPAASALQVEDALHRAIEAAGWTTSPPAPRPQSARGDDIRLESRDRRG